LKIDKVEAIHDHKAYRHIPTYNNETRYLPYLTYLDVAYSMI